MSPRKGARAESRWRSLPRQINGEHTHLTRNVAHRDVTGVRTDGAERDREPKPEARAVRASLRKWAKQFICLSWGKAAAFVADFDLNALGGSARDN